MILFRWIYIVLALPLIVAVGGFVAFAYFNMHQRTSGIIVAIAILGAVLRLVAVEGFGLLPGFGRPRSSPLSLAVKFVMLAVAYVCVSGWTYMGVCLPLRFGENDVRLPPAVHHTCEKASRWIDAHPKLFASLGLQFP